MRGQGAGMGVVLPQGQSQGQSQAVMQPLGVSGTSACSHARCLSGSCCGRGALMFCWQRLLTSQQL